MPNEEVNRIGDGLACGGALGAAVGAIRSGHGGIVENAVAGALLGGAYRCVRRGAADAFFARLLLQRPRADAPHPLDTAAGAS